MIYGWNNGFYFLPPNLGKHCEINPKLIGDYCFKFPTILGIRFKNNAKIRPSYARTMKIYLASQQMSDPPSNDAMQHRICLHFVCLIPMSMGLNMIITKQPSELQIWLNQKLFPSNIFKPQQHNQWTALSHYLALFPTSRSLHRCSSGQAWSHWQWLQSPVQHRVRCGSTSMARIRCRLKQARHGGWPVHVGSAPRSVPVIVYQAIISHHKPSKFEGLSMLFLL